MQFGGSGSSRVVPLAVAAFCALAPLRAEAGRRPFLFTYDSEIVPEGDVELEQWLWSESRIQPNSDRPTARPALYWIWWAPIIGANNHLEIALPFQVAASANNAGVDWFSGEIRYRLFSREKDSGIQPLLRVAVKQAIRTTAQPSTAEVDLVTTYGRPTQLHLSLDLGLSIALPWPEGVRRPIIADYAFGVAYPLVGNELRIATEFYGESALNNDAKTTPPNLPRHSIGASISWSRGRIWITAGSLFGLTGLSSATPPFTPRLLWAVAF